MPSPSKKVAILVESSTAYGRSLIRGIVEYANIASSWIFYNEPAGITEKRPDLSTWHCDGIIMRDTPENMPLLELDIPAIVAILYEEKVDGIPNIVSNCDEIAAIAVEHLMGNGLRQLAFCGFENRPFSQEREDAFLRAASAAQCVNLYRASTPGTDYNRELGDIAEWLTTLPKPTGLLACNDVRGGHVIEACKIAGIQVPQEISILGVNNDDLICEMASPALSSIVLDIRRAGYEAAKCLDRMMRGDTAAVPRIDVKATGLVERESTRILDINDPYVAAALHYIERHGKRNIQVRDVAEEVGLSRRTLERRFNTALKQSVYAAIKKSRINAMSRMLLETDLAVSEIAYNMDFADANHIARYFQAHTGMTPSAFRKYGTATRRFDKKERIGVHNRYTPA